MAVAVELAVEPVVAAAVAFAMFAEQSANTGVG